MPDLGDFSDFDAAAEAAEVVEPDTFTFKGQRFTIADRVSAVPMMRLAKIAATADAVAASQNPEKIAAAEIEGLVALYDFLEQSLIPGDFTRLADLATAHKLDDETLMLIAQRIYGVIAGRPTKQPSSSSAGRLPTSPSSKPTSSAMANAGLTPEDLASPEDALTLLRGVG